MPPTDPRRPADPSRPPTQPEMTSLPVIDLGNEGDVNLGDFGPADDEVPLAALPEPPSGQSLTSWTEVIRRQKAASQGRPGGADPVKVDAPSDKDLLTRLDAIGVRRTGDTSEILPGDLPLVQGPPSESDIDLGRLVAGARTGESSIRFDILGPPSDAGGAMPAPGRGDSGSSILMARPASDASLDLGADTGPAGEGGRSSILDVLLKDTGANTGGASSLLDVGFPAVRPGSRSGEAEPDREPAGIPGRDLVDSRPQLGSDEEVDLYAEPGTGPNLTDSGTLEISPEAVAESQRRTEAEESSSIDLSSRPSYSSGELEVALAAADGDADSAVDLNLPAAEDPANSSVFHRRTALAENSAVLAAELEARRRAPDADEASERRAAASGRGSARPRSGGYLVHGGILGLLLGAGSVLAAYFGGVLPNRQPAPKTTVPDNSAEVARLQRDVAAAKQEVTDAKADATRQVADAQKSGEAALAAARADAERAATDARKAMDEVQKAKADVESTRTELAAAQKAMDAARKAEDAARKEAAAAVFAKKAADTSLAGLTQALTAAGIDPTKPGDAVKKLTDARLAAEARAKEADARVAEATKKVAELTTRAQAAAKSYDDARKAAEDAVKARDASAAMVREITGRLAKAKFVGDGADTAAVLKGIDDAIRAGRTDTTAALRDELAKLKADLAAATSRAGAAEKAAVAARGQSEQTAAEARRLKTETDRLARALDAATGRAAAAEKAVAVARGQSEQTAAEGRRLKAEADRLARALEAVKELAALIQNPADGPAAKPDPHVLAERYFGDGVHAFQSGRYSEAAAAFRKVVQFQPADARNLYWLGLALWEGKETAAAQQAFERGRDLELAGRPSSRVISGSLERVQGAARQAVDAYRP